MLALAVGTILAGAVYATHAPADSGRATCGIERWAVKTLQDPAGRALDLTRVTRTTVAALRSLPVEPTGSRGQRVESTVYEVRAALLAAKIEEDGDVHLAVADPRTHGTMIVEFPIAACAARATQAAKERMTTAREALVRACGTPSSSSFTTLSGLATIRGVGFFDKIHGQRGVAPNGIELHPVLAFTNASCRRAPGSSGVTRGSGRCAPSYPTVCIPPPPPDLDCSDIPYRNFRVRYDVPNPDPHHFDGDRDGIGCES